ncbi:uncharacterized protein LOC131650661 [Vicia villosa]|uniref:uncharacterized protein LOC131650661 n=1 Tax=Vicia villosa TaxID=3911 RepID=UPI00273B0D91|nr:uncharacterized protein LOC131650661 [Vicia villosa]
MSHNTSLLLVLLLVYVSSSNSISKEVVEIDVICQKASNPSYCSNILNSKPGGAKCVSLVDLADYIIDALIDNSTNTNMLISRLIDQIGNNDTEINYYSKCKSNFIRVDGVIYKLIYASRDLTDMQYPAMVKGIDIVMEYVLECIDSLHQHKTSPLLANDVEVLRQGIQVLQIIAKYLNYG